MRMENFLSACVRRFGISEEIADGGGHQIERLGDGGERRTGEGHERGIIKGDQADILWHFEANGFGEAANVEGDRGTTGQDGGWSGRANGFRDPQTLVGGELRRVLHQNWSVDFFQLVLSQSCVKAFDSVEGVGIARAGTDEEKTLMVEASKVLDCAQGGEHVIGIDADAVLDGPSGTEDHKWSRACPGGIDGEGLLLPGIQQDERLSWVKVAFEALVAVEG